MASPNANKPNRSITKDEIRDALLASSAWQEIHSWLADWPTIEIDDDDDASDDFFINYDYQLDYDILDGHEFESFLAFLAPAQDANSAYDNFSFDGIMEHIHNCSKHHKRTEDDMISDIVLMVHVGLSFGNIRQAHIEVQFLTDLKESRRLLLVVRLAKNGAESVLASEQLPDAMKHAGFPGLIPKRCDPYLMKAYLYAHAAYMVDYGMLINSDDKRSMKELALSQMNFSKVGVEQVPYSDEFRVNYLRKVGLTEADVFKKIVDVCNNLCKEVGEPELSWETAEKYHIKNNTVCFFEDENKDAVAGALTENVVDKLKVASILDSFTSKI
ncbi:hypothetical protein QVD17_10693 [Tagetes erecta]|uniref:Uncharacterized protein n=1 Tax=Tagetes erecta TaxID=13708 RepID=A0AAD8L719_TARER|nr:hypothetical protein QVD17_10693 [Tagetes erecta]